MEVNRRNSFGSVFFQIAMTILSFERQRGIAMVSNAIVVLHAAKVAIASRELQTRIKIQLQSVVNDGVDSFLHSNYASAVSRLRRSDESNITVVMRAPQR